MPKQSKTITKTTTIFDEDTGLYLEIEDDRIIDSSDCYFDMYTKRGDQLEELSLHVVETDDGDFLFLKKDDDSGLKLLIDINTLYVEDIVQDENGYLLKCINNDIDIILFAYPDNIPSSLKCAHETVMTEIFEIYDEQAKQESCGGCVCVEEYECNTVSNQDKMSIDGGWSLNISFDDLPDEDKQSIITRPLLLVKK